LLRNDQHFQPSLQHIAHSPYFQDRNNTLSHTPCHDMCSLLQILPPSNTFYRRTYTLNLSSILRTYDKTPQQSHFYCCSAQPHGNKEKLHPPHLKIIYRRKFFRETKRREINIKRRDGRNFFMHVTDSGKITPVNICGG
jgi:hypothetical protein